MARRKQTGRRSGSGRAPKERGTSPPGVRSLLWLRIGWITAAAVVLFVIVSVASFDLADPPSAFVSPANDPVKNWCGRVGAAISFALIELLGIGVWVLIAMGVTALAVTGSGRRITHPWVRVIGTCMIAVAVASMQALVLPDSGPAPGLGGGLVGTTVTAEMLERFNAVGTFLWLALLLVVGTTVALDVWAIVAAAWTGRAVVAAGRSSTRLAGGLAGGLVTRLPKALSTGETSPIRENDVDDDRPVDQEDEPTVRRVKRGRAAAATEEFEDHDAAHDSDPHSTGHEPDHDEDSHADATAAADEDNQTDAQEDEDELPGAPQVFSADALREKISKLPVRFAARTSRSATEEDLRDIQNVSFMEGYDFPGLDLLEEPEANYSAEMEAFVREQAEALERALQEYRIKGEVVGIDSGPVITMYEVRLAPGTKVAQVQAISSDLARSLKAINIRIVPNMAGRDTVGVEVPNAKKEKVRLKELMSDREHYGSMKLPMFLGKDASGNPLIGDLSEMPHLLIAGTTGSGKSVCMNTIIMSFLYTRKPSELKLVLVDPKMVELSQFKDIPHLMCPVVTEMAKAAAILEWAVGKMEERYELLAEAGCRDITAYNELEWEDLKDAFRPETPEEEARIPRKLPYMVFVIDELADLMMTNKEVETSIVRIAQKARAVGIHLIIATQRPQANVVTGLIKSNMPARICFKVSSGMDSRIVMDQKGGELLLGQGDMLYLSPRSSKLTRAQGTLVDDKEIRRVVRFVKSVSGPSFERQLVQIRTEPMDADAQRDGFINAQEDPLFDQAVEIVLETKRGSVSMLQRRLAIGYTRAARLVEMMGEAGILGTHKGTVAREVAMTLDEWRAMKEQYAADLAQAAAAREAAGEATAGDAVNAAESDAAPWEEQVDAAESDADAAADSLDEDEDEDEEEVEGDEDDEEWEDSEDEDDIDEEEDGEDEADEQWEEDAADERPTGSPTPTVEPKTNTRSNGLNAAHPHDEEPALFNGGEEDETEDDRGLSGRRGGGGR